MMTGLIRDGRFALLTENFFVSLESAIEHVNAVEPIVDRAVAFDPYADGLSVDVNAFDYATAAVVLADKLDLSREMKTVCLATVAHYIMAYGAVPVDMLDSLTFDDVRACTAVYGRKTGGFIALVLARIAMFTDRGGDFAGQLLPHFGAWLAIAGDAEHVAAIEAAANVQARRTRDAFLVWSRSGLIAGEKWPVELNLQVERLSPNASV